MAGSGPPQSELPELRAWCMTQAEYISSFLSGLAGAKGSTLSRPQSTLLGVSLGKLVTHMEENGNSFSPKGQLRLLYN